MTFLSGARLEIVADSDREIASTERTILSCVFGTKVVLLPVVLPWLKDHCHSLLGELTQGLEDEPLATLRPLAYSPPYRSCGSFGLNAVWQSWHSIPAIGNVF